MKYILGHSGFPAGAEEVHVPCGVELYLYTKKDEALPLVNAFAALALDDPNIYVEKITGPAKVTNFELTGFPSWQRQAFEHLDVKGTALYVGDDVVGSPVKLCNGDGGCTADGHTCTGVLGEFAGEPAIRILCCRISYEDIEKIDQGELTARKTDSLTPKDTKASIDAHLAASTSIKNRLGLPKHKNARTGLLQEELILLNLWERDKKEGSDWFHSRASRMGKERLANIILSGGDELQEALSMREGRRQVWEGTNLYSTISWLRSEKSKVLQAWVDSVSGGQIEQGRKLVAKLTSDIKAKNFEAAEKTWSSLTDEDRSHISGMAGQVRTWLLERRTAEPKNFTWDSPGDVVNSWRPYVEKHIAMYLKSLPRGAKGAALVAGDGTQYWLGDDFTGDYDYAPVVSFLNSRGDVLRGTFTVARISPWGTYHLDFDGCPPEAFETMAENLRCAGILDVQVCDIPVEFVWSDPDTPANGWQESVDRHLADMLAQCEAGAVGPAMVTGDGIHYWLGENFDGEYDFRPVLDFLNSCGDLHVGIFKVDIGTDGTRLLTFEGCPPSAFQEMVDRVNLLGQVTVQILA